MLPRRISSGDAVFEGVFSPGEVWISGDRRVGWCWPFRIRILNHQVNENRNQECHDFGTIAYLCSIASGVSRRISVDNLVPQDIETVKDNAQNHDRVLPLEGKGELSDAFLKLGFPINLRIVERVPEWPIDVFVLDQSMD